jgi:putative AlgH/UPF0301 family transcriptional regulator
MASIGVLILLLLACLVFRAGSLRLRHGRSISINRHRTRLSSTSFTDDFIPTEICQANELKRGVVLLAQPDDHGHFVMRAAVLLFDHGSDRGSRGVILEKPTAFTMGETTGNAGPFEANSVFLGGGDGSDTAIMLHRYDLEGFAKYIGSGIYVGGLKQAREMVESYKAKPKDFKFVFNTLEWAPGHLEKEVADGRWDLVHVPPHMITEQGPELGKLWSKARNSLISQGLLKRDVSGADSDEDDGESITSTSVEQKDVGDDEEGEEEDDDDDEEMKEECSCM